MGDVTLTFRESDKQGLFHVYVPSVTHKSTNPSRGTLTVGGGLHTTFAYDKQAVDGHYLVRKITKAGFQNEVIGVRENEKEASTRAYLFAYAQAKKLEGNYNGNINNQTDRPDPTLAELEELVTITS